MPNENLAKCMAYAYPDLVREVDYDIVQHSSKIGPVIEDWNGPGEKPTVESVMANEAAWIAARDAVAYQGLRRKDIEATPAHEREEARREQIAAILAELSMTPTKKFAAQEAIVAAAKLKYGAP